MLQFKNKILVVISTILIIGLVILSVVLDDFKVDNPEDYIFLPKLNAILNGLSFISLVIAYRFIKKGNKKRHVNFIILALIFTVLFLVSYLTYHFISPPTKFGGEGLIKYFYLFILLSHVLLAGVILPLIMITILLAIENKFDMHKKYATITLPLWLYVSLTGVIVFLLNSPYY